MATPTNINTSRNSRPSFLIDDVRFWLLFSNTEHAPFTTPHTWHNRVWNNGLKMQIKCQRHSLAILRVFRTTPPHLRKAVPQASGHSLCLASIRLWANAARSSSAMSSSAGLLTHRLPILSQKVIKFVFTNGVRRKINGKSFRNTQERADRFLWHAPIDHITCVTVNRSGQGCAMGVHLGQVIDSRAPRN